MAEFSKLGVFDAETFDLHDTKGEHAGKARGDLIEFMALLRSAGQPLSVEPTQAHGKYLDHSGSGRFFRALARIDNDPRLAFMSAVAFDHDEETKVCEVEGMFNREADERTIDGIFYLWVKKIIPQFSLVHYLELAFAQGTESAGFRFPHARDEATDRLFETFGMEEAGSWIIPTPRIALLGSKQVIADLLERQQPPTDRVVAMVSEGDETTETEFYEGGVKLGTLEEGVSVETDKLSDANGEGLAIWTPDYGDRWDDMGRYFNEPAIRRQLGLVTLKRALAT